MKSALLLGLLATLSVCLRLETEDLLLGLGLLHRAGGAVLLHPGALPVEEFMQRPPRLPRPQLLRMRRQLRLPIRLLS